MKAVQVVSIFVAGCCIVVDGMNVLLIRLGAFKDRTDTWPPPEVAERSETMEPLEEAESTPFPTISLPTSTDVSTPLPSTPSILATAPIVIKTATTNRETSLHSGPGASFDVIGSVT